MTGDVGKKIGPAGSDCESRLKPFHRVFTVLRGVRTYREVVHVGRRDYPHALERCSSFTSNKAAYNLR